MQTLYVVSHTHWDREWYEPFQVFRMRLVRCIDRLLDLFETDPEYKYFLLDGQTIVLEDYAEVRPDRMQTLHNLIRAGKVQIGPWYVLPDEFLVSGESIIRNLMRGLKIAREFDGGMRVGYIPDPFGHISQMPQILRGFGINAAVFRRGLADEPVEVWWQGADGTRILACYLREGYGNLAWPVHDDDGFVSGMRQERDALAPYSATGQLLLLNGTDHMEPWPDLTRLLGIVREQIVDTTILHASLPQYVENVQAEIAARRPELPTVRGELRNPKRHHLLPAVASARMWIKQRNARAQMLLEKWAEPTTAFVSWLATGKAQSTSSVPLLDLAWKYLLQNHPHDSICGCGVDLTHADMVPRFEWVEQIAQPLIQENLKQLANAVQPAANSDAIPVVVFNPTAGPRTDLVQAKAELVEDNGNYVLLDEAGREIPYVIHNRTIVEYYRAETTAELLGQLIAMAQDGQVMGMAIENAYIKPDTNPIQLDVTLTAQGQVDKALLQERLVQIRQVVARNENVLYDVYAHSPTNLKIEFVAPAVPGHGYRTFYLTPSAQPSAAESFSAPSAENQATPVLENEFLRVEPNPADGTLAITDKLTGLVLNGANRFIDGGDRGDLYNYCPPEADTEVAPPSAPPRIEFVRGPVSQSLVITALFRLPARLNDERTARSQDYVDECIVSTISLYTGIRRMDFSVQVENLARDHRLQVEFPTPIVTDIVSAEQAFDVIVRDIALPRDTADWIEQPRPEAPMQNFVSLTDSTRGLTLATRGLPEYAARKDDQGVALVLTLLRCVGWLSWGNLANRSGDAGPHMETPGAQEIGTFTFEYALLPHAGDWHNSVIDAQGYAAPFQAVAISPARSRTGDATLPASACLVQVTPRDFVISAIKPASSGRGLIVRGYNLGAEPIEADLVLMHPFEHAARVNLNEEWIEPVELHDGNHVRLTVKPKEIVTLRFSDAQAS